MATNKYSIDSLKSVLQKELGTTLPESCNEMLKLAYLGHTGQFRESVDKNQKIPYIVHPVGVASLVIRHYELVRKSLKENLETLICAALAHDLIEDTRITRDQIKAIGGDKVLRLVEALTKLPNPNHTHFLKRNEEIRERTLAAGPGAVYLRACDSMHNLSWPHITPATILTKGINRAHEVYLPLLAKAKLGKDIQNIFETKIAEATTYNKTHNTKKNIQTQTPETIGEAIHMCASFTHKKILELHDIADILRNITGADTISTWSPHGKTDGYFKPAIIAGEHKTFVEKIKESNIDFVAHEITQNKIKNFIPHPSLSGRYFLLTLRISVTSRYLILLTFERAPVPTWATITNLEFLIDSLSERLIVANGDYKRSLVATASSLGMRFDVDWADQLSIEPGHLIELHAWQKRAQQAIRQVIHACELFFEQEAEKNPLRDLIKIESRVKETASIMRKFLPPSHAVWPHFDQLPDIAGVRVICPTKKWVLNLRKYLTGKKMSAFGIKVHKVHKERDYTKNPTIKGYRALHLVLSVDTQLHKKKIAIPCEVQIHTMVQDIWAKIAHRISYKHDESSDTLRRQLRNIGENLDDLDSLVDTIAK